MTIWKYIPLEFSRRNFKRPSMYLVACSMSSMVPFKPLKGITFWTQKGWNNYIIFTLHRKVSRVPLYVGHATLTTNVGSLKISFENSRNWKTVFLNFSKWIIIIFSKNTHKVIIVIFSPSPFRNVAENLVYSSFHSIIIQDLKYLMYFFAIWNHKIKFPLNVFFSNL